MINANSILMPKYRAIRIADICFVILPISGILMIRLFFEFFFRFSKIELNALFKATTRWKLDSKIAKAPSLSPGPDGLMNKDG